MASNTITKTTKTESKKLPKGARITRSNTRTEVEEIENGFLLTKTTDSDYVYPIDDGKEERGYSYETKKWFSKTDPLEIKIGKDADKSLADSFNDE